MSSTPIDALKGSSSVRYVVGVWCDKTQSYAPTYTFPDEPKARAFMKALAFNMGLAGQPLRPIHLMKQTLEFLATDEDDL